MKRSLSFGGGRETALVVAGTGLVAGTYGLVRLAYGLFLPDIRASLGIGATTAGYVASGASIVYCLGALTGTVAGGRPRVLVLGALLTAGVGAVGMAVATDVATFAALAVLSSAGAGLASPGLVGVVERNVRAADRDRAQAVVNAGTGPGLVAAGLMALVLLPRWQLGFVVAAALTAAAGGAVLLLDRARPAPDEHPAAPPHALPRDDHAWVRNLGRPATAALLLGAGSASVWTYGRTLLVAQGSGDDASVVAWIAVGIGGSATVLTAGRLVRLTPSRAWLLTCGVVAVAVGTLAAGASHPVVALVGCAVFGWSFVAASTALIAWAGAVVPARAAAGTSLLFVMLVLGQAAGSTLVGAVGDARGLPLGFALAAAVTGVAAAVGLVPTGAAGRDRPGVRRGRVTSTRARRPHRRGSTPGSADHRGRTPPGPAGRH